jgi:hypothetical protein
MTNTSVIVALREALPSPEAPASEFDGCAADIARAMEAMRKAKPCGRLSVGLVPACSDCWSSMLSAFVANLKQCPKCGGSQTVGDTICPECGGAG